MVPLYCSLLCTKVAIVQGKWRPRVCNSRVKEKPKMLPCASETVTKEVRKRKSLTQNSFKGVQVALLNRPDRQPDVT